MNKIKKFLVGGAAAALLLGSAVTAFAATSNGSFEAGINPGVFTTLSAGDSTSITDWTVGLGGIDYIGSYWTASDGVKSLDLSSTAAGSVSQTLTTVVGNTYRVTFDMAGNPDGLPVIKTLNADTGGAPIPFTFDTTGRTKLAMGWTQKTFNFTATGTSTVLTFTSADATFFGPALDNVAINDITLIPAECNQNVTYNVVQGTSGSDNLVGTSGRDLILAKGGSDNVDGLDGNDCIVGGNGSDNLVGGAGNDVLLGQGGSDALAGGLGNDKLWGGADSDSLKGDDGNDSLDGGAGSDAANGGAGTDTCTAEAVVQCSP